MAPRDPREFGEDRLSRPGALVVMDEPAADGEVHRVVRDGERGRGDPR